MAKPFFTAIAAVTIDGKIAAYKGQNSSWTSKEDKRFLRRILDRSDVVLVGHTTYKVAIKPLSKRNCIVLTRSVAATLQKNPLVMFCNSETVNILDLIRRLGYKKIAVLGGQQVYSFCLKHKLLDEIFLTIEPIIFGRGLNLFETEIPKLKVMLVSIKKLNSSGVILLHYKKLRP